MPGAKMTRGTDSKGPETEATLAWATSGGRGDPSEPQRRHFADVVEGERFRWQTGNPYVSSREKELISILAGEDPSAWLLEVGCGEGANLANLDGYFQKMIGLDFSRKRVEFCQRHVRGAQFSCGDATNLPFRSESFDVVLCRDLLHHVADDRPVISEMRRVCKGGGRLLLIEANGRNPMIFLQGMLFKIERSVWKASPKKYLQLLATNDVSVASVTMLEPLPLFRFLLHHRFGFPGLARLHMVTKFLDLVERVAARVVPKSGWAYIVIAAKKPF